MNRCWPRVPAHHLSELYGIGAAKLARLQEQGWFRIGDLPEDVGLAGAQERQRRAVASGRIVVEAGLAAALAKVVEPVVYLDFETIAPAIPVWDGCGPYEAVAVQFSVHRRGENGEVLHTAWLAERGGDPREGIARALIEATDGAGCVVAYNAPFEARCIRGLAEAVPELAGELMGVVERLVDLLPIVRGFVYHPGFRGSFSLKAVAPALVDGLGYEDLEIDDGFTASAELEAMLIGDGEPGELARLRADLLAYCARDTEVLVRVHERLLELAGCRGKT